MHSKHSPTCALVLIAKDEGPYLLEWVAWHRMLGFDEIVVYDNQSSDGGTDLLRALDAAGVVTVRHWTRGATESPQITAYNDAIGRCDKDWMLFIDTDEFLVLHADDSIGAWLVPFHEREDVGAVGINWRLFGDNGMAAPDGRPVTERFTRGAEDDFPNNAHIKTCHRRDRIESCNSMHLCQVAGEVVHASGKPLTLKMWGVTTEVDYGGAQINHYFTRTAAEYEEKKRRGRGGFPQSAPEKYNYDRYAFDWHNRNDVEDLCAARKTPQLRAAMADLVAMIERVTA